MIIDYMVSICFDGRPVFAMPKFRVWLWPHCITIMKADHDLSFTGYSIMVMDFAFMAIAHQNRLQGLRVGSGWSWLQNSKIWKNFRFWQNYSPLIESNARKSSSGLSYYICFYSLNLTYNGLGAFISVFIDQLLAMTIKYGFHASN